MAHEKGLQVMGSFGDDHKKLLNLADDFRSQTYERMDNQFMPFIAWSTGEVLELVKNQSAAIREKVSRIAQLEAELTATNALVAAVAAAVDGAWNKAVAECEISIGTAFDKTGNIMDILKAVAALKRPTQSKPH